MSLSTKIYNIRKNGKQEGDVFTSPKVACYILDLIGYTPDKNLSQYNIPGAIMWRRRICDRNHSSHSHVCPPS